MKQTLTISGQEFNLNSPEKRSKPIRIGENLIANLEPIFMNYRTYSQRLEYLRELIEKDRLCSPVEVANQFNCSERTVRKMINDLRSSGLEIKYSRKNFKYFLG